MAPQPAASPLKSVPCASNGQYLAGEVIALERMLRPNPRDYAITGRTGTDNNGEHCQSDQYGHHACRSRGQPGLTCTDRLNHPPSISPRVMARSLQVHGRRRPGILTS